MTVLRQYRITNGTEPIFEFTVIISNLQIDTKRTPTQFTNGSELSMFELCTSSAVLNIALIILKHQRFALLYQSGYSLDGQGIDHRHHRF